MVNVKKFFIKKYNDLIIEDAIEINGVKYIRVILEDYPKDDWSMHPYSGGSRFEDWEICTYLPLSPSGKVLYFPTDIDELSGYEIDSLVINGERFWAWDIIMPMFSYSK